VLGYGKHKAQGSPIIIVLMAAINTTNQDFASSPELLFLFCGAIFNSKGLPGFAISYAKVCSISEQSR
jgi:hypothetical protein